MLAISLSLRLDGRATGKQHGWQRVISAGTQRLLAQDFSASSPRDIKLRLIGRQLLSALLILRGGASHVSSMLL